MILGTADQFGTAFALVKNDISNNIEVRQAKLRLYWAVVSSTQQQPQSTCHAVGKALLG